MKIGAFRRVLANRIWMTACSAKHAQFLKSLECVEKTQATYLMGLIRRNTETKFGKKHGFSRIRTSSDYQQAVAVAEYSDFSDYIEAIARGETDVLTSEPVKLFHPTSGSLSATKLIPWTASLAAEFQRGIAPWMVSLYRRKPTIMWGTAYWSISPSGAAIKTHGSIRVGFDDDSDYLGLFGKKLFSEVSAVSPEVAKFHDTRQFRMQTLISLLESEALSLISVWSPTFLTVLLEEMMRGPDAILDALANSCRPGAKKRAAFLSGALESGDEWPFEAIWPNLQVISCWTHGASELYAENLRRQFPHVEIQPKGLVATEAFVSLPFQTGFDPVLSVNSHFYEFCDVATGKIYLAHELSEGCIYSVIVTTGGGLYRYKLGDLVRVSGFINQAPCLRFIAREGISSDLFGEKLHSSVVEELIRISLARLNIAARFFLLAPTLDSAGRASYTLFLDAEQSSNITTLQQIIEAGLSENFHYAHCRQLGQLAQSRVFLIHRKLQSSEDIFLTEIQSRGQKTGEIKMVALDSHLGWDHRFIGKFE